MAINRTMKCDGCGAEEKEREPNAGWASWSGMQGVQLNGVALPNFCPSCTGKIMEFIDKEIVHGLD